MPKHAANLALLALLHVSATSHAQLISSFESPEDLWALRPSGGVKATRVKEQASHGEYALKCLFPGSEKDTWPGLVFTPKQTDLAKYQVLAFDVYVPGDRAQHLSMRIDGANGKNTFGGKSLAPGKWTTYEVFIKGLASNIGTTKIKRFYPYVRMPREDVVLYIDNLRFATVDLRFTPLVYEETSPPLEPTAEEQKRGYVLFARHWLDVVFPNSRPRTGEREARLRTFATPGEYEPLTFSVRALRDLKQARVTLSPLRGPQGRIPASAVTVYPVRCLNKRVTYSSKQYVKDMPVLLERRPAVDIASGESKRFWLDVRVPAAAPGMYEGAATFAADNAASARVPITVRVLPFRLVEPKGLLLGEYYQGPRLAKDAAQQREFLTRDLRDMREHGATSVGLCIGFPGDQAKRTPTGVAIELDGESLWEHFMDTYRDLGFPAPIVMLSDSGQAFAGRHSEKLLDAEYVAAYKAFWAAVQKLCAERGWPEIIVQPVDEPGWRDRQAKDRNVALLKLLKQIPGMRTEQDGPGDAYFHTEAGPYADVWNYNGGIGTAEQVAQAKREGRLVMIYNCDVESYRPEIGRYVPGFFQHRAGIDGCYNWAYMSWRGGPYDDLDHTTGTWMHVYPEYQGEVGGPSTGWQGFREGVDDTKYVATLQAAMARASKAGTPQASRAAAQGKLTLRRVLDSIQYSPRARSRARWTSTRTETRGGKTRKIISGTLELPNGWSFATYDLARWQIAQSTLETLAALGEIQPETRKPVALAEPKGPFAQVEWRTTKRARRAVGSTAEQMGIPATAEPPRIDGDISDAAWRQAAKVAGFELSKGGKPQQQTVAWLCADKANLYIAFKCHEDNMGHLTANVAQDGGRVWEDDCVEVFIDGNLDRRTCRQIVVNSLGKQYWSDADAPGWRAQSVAAAKVASDAWCVELAIPLRNAGLTGNVFGLNLCRERRPMETLELSCWQPTGGMFRQPEKFGLARIGPSFLRGIDAGRSVVGQNTLAAVIANEAGRATSFVAHVRSSQESAEPGIETSAPFTLAAGETRTVMLPYVVHRADEPVRLRFGLREAGSRKLCAQYELARDVQPPLTLRLGRSIYHLADPEAIVEVHVAIGADAAKETALGLTLRQAGAGAPLRSQTVSPMAGDHMVGRLCLAGLPEGAYELEVTLRHGRPGAPLARSVVTLTMLRGAFD